MTSILVLLAVSLASYGSSAAQTVRDSSGSTPKALSLNRSNDGQHLSAKIGQPIVITMQTIGGGNYDSPQISSRAVKFESVNYPRTQNPGGPTQIYHFSAVAAGETQIKIAHTGSNPAVTFTIRVTK